MEEKESGPRDIDGAWIEEARAAKLRNQLNVFWSLSTMMADKSMRDRFMSDPKIQELVFGMADQCEKNKEKILRLISELAVIEDSKDLK